jgi:predicted nucleotidyltransferase
LRVEGGFDVLLDTETLIAEIGRSVKRLRPQPAFSCLFGSAAQDRLTPVSDIDVGLYFTEEVELLELGGLAGELEDRLGRRIDLVELQSLPKRNPAFSYRIASHMIVVTGHNSSEVVTFKKWSYLEYLDTEPLRRRMDAALKKRLAEGRAGDRNYVG